MFCNQCGGEVPEQARFCNHCGATTAVDGGAAPATDPQATDPPGAGPTREPAVALKPVFVPAVAVATVVPLTIFFTLWGGGFFGGFGMFAVQALGLPLPPWFTFVFFGALFLLGIPLLVYRVQKSTYEKTEYRFFADRLEYYEGFFTVEEKTVPLANVTEVHLRKGVVQSRHGLGTIVLSTPATITARGMSGIRIHDVEDPDEVYRSVKELVERARRGDARRAA